MVTPTEVSIGYIFVFELKIQDARTYKMENALIHVAAYDFEQAISSLERVYPELTPIVDEIRLRKAVGEFEVPHAT
jgi:hypothetical protein